jgi:type IV pilus assembly protein PilO
MSLLPSDPQQRKLALLLLVVAGGGGYFFYDQVYTPRSAEIEQLGSRLETLELQNRRARALTAGAGVDQVQLQLEQYRDQLGAVEKLIPSSEELPDLLDAIAAEARSTGVDLTLIQPVDAREEQFYTRRVYDLAVLGSFHEVTEFLTRVGSLQRIVTPVNLNLSGSKEQTRDGLPKLQARFSIQTYVVPQPEGELDATE